jgi:predicted RND superfamily exporter protein
MRVFFAIVGILALFFAFVPPVSELSIGIALLVSMACFASAAIIERIDWSRKTATEERQQIIAELQQLNASLAKPAPAEPPQDETPGAES